MSAEKVSRGDVSDLLRQSARKLGLEDSPTTRKLLAKLETKPEVAETSKEAAKQFQFPDRGGVVV